MEYIQDLIPPEAFVSLVQKAKALAESEDRLLTVPEVAKRLGISRTTMWRWSKNESLPVYKLPGGHIRIRESDLEKFMENYNFVHSKNTQEKTSSVPRGN